MSELTEQRWAVLSERGLEATGLTYQQAAELMRSLVREKVSGLSVITDDAAHRAAPDNLPQSRKPGSSGVRTLRHRG